ncbi:MAG TPA: GntR family transcriptional regulator [Synechococcales cyanobacterium M55_K2018_004]|nr:GntR family transcriptional regulator [Synechococcales cyanobacterium M55_K2018_004]
MALSLAPIQRPKSLHEQTYDALRASILSGELPPNVRLVETQLAEKFGVSRTPIREAIRQLQREALVTADDSGNLRVATITVADAVQLYDCRLALEQLAVEGACLQASDAQLQCMDDLITQAEQYITPPTSTQYYPIMLELDYQFHRLIAESSGNRWLVMLLEQVFDKMALLRVQTTRSNPRVLEIRFEHRQVYQGILAARRSDHPQAAIAPALQAIQTHLMASKARVVEAVQSLQQTTQN